MMPHVDDGTLHALLDGALRAEAPERAAEVEAHVAACGDCRARLEAAEELREEASAILAGAAAEDVAAAPDFADVVRRAETGPAPGAEARRWAGSRHNAGPLGRQARWTRGVAWAASLVLALGTGYLIRDLAGPTVDENPSRALGPDAAETPPSPVREPTADDPAATRPRVFGDVGAPSERDASTAAATDEPGARSGGVDAHSGGVDARPGEVGAPPVEVGAEESAAPAPPPPAPTADASVAAPAERTETDVSRGGRETPTRAQLTSESTPESERADTRALPGAAQISSSFQSVPERWSTVTAEEARTILGGVLYLLPRAELMDVYALADDPEGRVLSVQRLQTGVPVQVVQWRAREEEEAAAGQAEGSAAKGAEAATQSDGQPRGRVAGLMDAALPEANVARVIRGDYILELTGALPAALLSVLGETAGPATP